MATQAKLANKEGGTGVGGKVVTLVLDMTNRDEVAGLLTKLDKDTKVDVLVNNAGQSLLHLWVPLLSSLCALLFEWSRIPVMAWRAVLQAGNRS